MQGPFQFAKIGHTVTVCVRASHRSNPGIEAAPQGKERTTRYWVQRMHAHAKASIYVATSPLKGKASTYCSKVAIKHIHAHELLTVYVTGKSLNK